MRLLVCCCLLCLAGLPSASEVAAQETPHAGVRAIIALYENKDFEQLIRNRYAEIDKAENEEQVLALIERFSKRFEDETELRTALELYRGLLNKQPTLSDDKQTAVWKTDRGTVTLKLIDESAWGFTL